MTYVWIGSDSVFYFILFFQLLTCTQRLARTSNMIWKICFKQNKRSKIIIKLRVPIVYIVRIPMTAKKRNYSMIIRQSSFSFKFIIINSVFGLADFPFSMMIYLVQFVPTDRCAREQKKKTAKQLDSVWDTFAFIIHLLTEQKQFVALPASRCWCLCLLSMTTSIEYFII